MIIKYLIERRSWIILFLFIQLLIVFIAFIDPMISFHSILYIVFLCVVIFFIFVIVRYHKEAKFYKSLIERENNLNLSSVPHPESPFEKIIEQSMTDQTQQLQQLTSQSLMTIEQEKDNLLSWIHEVKTPLTAMKLMIERLEDHNLKSHMSYEWLRIHLLLDQQLHEKRIPFIENDLYIEKTDLESLVYTEIKTLQSWCIQKGIGFDIQLEEVEVLSDVKWLSFMIRQLLTNAVKYSETSDIIIKSYYQDDQVIVEIQDFGKGIDSKDLPRIFDKGFTTTAHHRDNAATGMGLYLSKKIAKSLSIHIHVDSKLELGTTLTLTFPKRNEFVNIISM